MARWLRVGLAGVMGGLMLVSGAHALTMTGPLQVQSLLNQPFTAEIPYGLDPGEEEPRIEVLVGMNSDFSGGGEARTRLSARLLENPPQAGSSARTGRILITGSRPETDPFLTILVRVIRADLSFVRNYAVVLDAHPTTGVAPVFPVRTGVKSTEAPLVRPAEPMPSQSVGGWKRWVAGWSREQLAGIAGAGALSVFLLIRRLRSRREAQEEEASGAFEPVRLPERVEPVVNDKPEPVVVAAVPAAAPMAAVLPAMAAVAAGLSLDLAGEHAGVPSESSIAPEPPAGSAIVPEFLLDPLPEAASASTSLPESLSETHAPPQPEPLPEWLSEPQSEPPPPPEPLPELLSEPPPPAQPESMAEDATESAEDALPMTAAVALILPDGRTPGGHEDAELLDFAVFGQDDGTEWLPEVGEAQVGHEIPEESMDLGSRDFWSFTQDSLPAEAAPPRPTVAQEEIEVLAFDFVSLDAPSPVSGSSSSASSAAAAPDSAPSWEFVPFDAADAGRDDEVRGRREAR
ncbi:MAG: hypothetical protein HQL91_05510 [Magnetococcales bacterium]|nr:hypothetical protein [Magnetococcales bacterium]